MLSDASPYWRARLESRGFNEERVVVADSAHHGDDDDEDEQDEGMVDSDADVSDSSSSDSDSDSDSDSSRDDDDDQKCEEQLRIENNETATMTGTSTRRRGGRGGGGGEMPVRVVAIEDGTSFRTYRALVAFLYTGEIEFTPVRSKFASRSERRSHLALSRARATQSRSSSSSCCQCSPKSLFALAHFLSLDDHNDDSSKSEEDACAPAPRLRRRRRTVSSVALEAYRSQLTLENALDELLSPFCETYEAAREVVVDWILDDDDQDDDDQDDLDLDDDRDLGRSGTTGRARTKTNKTRWDKLRKCDEVRRWKERVEKGGISIGELDLLFKLSGISG